MFVVFIGSGLRVGELTGLTWDDVNFEDETISVNHSMTYRKIDGEYRFSIDTPKTKNGFRTVPMFPEVREALHAQKRKNFKNGFISPTVDGYTDFVFLNGSGNLYPVENINVALRNIVRHYNEQEQENAKNENREPILMPHISCHIFRHTFATRLCESTHDIKVIQSAMGHSNIATTMDIYAECEESHKKATFKGLESKFKIS
jgi:integrase